MDCKADAYPMTTGEKPELYPVSMLDENVGDYEKAFPVESQYDSIIEIRELPDTDGFYNAAVLYLNGAYYLLGRQIGKAGKENEPDVGSLVLKTLDDDGNIIHSEEVWNPNTENGGREYLLEDARSLTLSDGRAAIGLTYVTREGGDSIPHPAVLIVNSIERLKEVLNDDAVKCLGKIAIKQAFAGQSPDQEAIGDQTTPISESINETNITPIGKNVIAISSRKSLEEDDKHTYSFAFRPEGNINNHRLHVFEHSEDGEVDHRQFIDFPKDIPWAEFRIGTTVPPIWLNENEAIFPIHGSTLVNGKYVYSIGTTRLLRDKDGNLSVDNISQESVINPDLFDGMFDGDKVELHPERRVVYCCGGIPTYDNSGKYNNLKLYVNVGDKRTVEVTMSMAEMVKNWDRGEYTGLELPIVA